MHGHAQMSRYVILMSFDLGVYSGIKNIKIELCEYDIFHDSCSIETSKTKGFNYLVILSQEKVMSSH